MGQGKLRTICAASIAAVLLMLGQGGAPLAGREPAPVQLAQAPNPFLQVQRAVPDDADELSGVNLPTNRRVKRDLDKVPKLIEEGHYSEVTRFLGEILGGGDSAEEEDAFFESDTRKANNRGLKAEAREILGRLPPEGRQVYELQFGARARRMLTDAVEKGDVALLAEVSRRFFHTEAGYQATFLLARHQLDHGRSLAAALAYQQLLDAGSAAARFEPSLSLGAAVSWVRCGMEDKASAVMADLQRRHPDAKALVAGKETPVFSQPGGALAWIEQLAGQPSEAALAREEAWPLFRGSGGRNAATDGGRPLLSHRWRVRTVNNPAIERMVGDLRSAYQHRDVAMLPSLHPLAVGDVVLMRTAQHLLAVDFRTGKIAWEFRPGRNDSFEKLVKLSSNQQLAGQVPQLTLGLEQRMWDDATYGTISSDGERVYVIQDLDLVSTMNYRTAIFFGGRQTLDSGPKAANRLSALELPTEGKLVWEVGGADSVAERLREAFFLGPPLPVSGQLYVLAEIKGGIRLVVLDAKTGRLEWWQQLADMEHNITQDPYRRLAGATPSFSDGVLVCPTSAGAVVAVDSTSRSLLWAYKYPQRYTSHQQRMMMRGYSANQERTNDQWVDSTATVVDRLVLLTPPESNRIFCLQLLDGSEVWSEDRGENLYVACVHKGRVILVGKKHVSALDLQTGKNAWKGGMLSLPEGSLPSGRGYYSDQFYYLPLSSAEVVKIDLEEGKIVETARSQDGHIPGNLICYRGEVVSQGVDYVETYYQVESLQQRIAKALEKNPQDPDALARQGEIELDRGNLDEAIAHFTQSFELEPNLLTRELLVKALLAGMEKDFAANRGLAARLEKLIDQPEQQMSLLRLMAAGLQQSGETTAALESYLQLVELQAGESPEMEDLEGKTLSVRRDRWIQAQLADLYREASSDERERIDEALSERVAVLDHEAVSTTQLRSFLSYFGELPHAEPLRERLSAKLAKADTALECQMLLLRLEQSGDPARRRAAVARLAQLFKAVGQVDSAAIYYRRLLEEHGDEVCLDGLTGNEIVEKLAEQDAVRKGLDRRDPWPRGAVKETRGRPSRAGQVHHRRIYPMELKGQTDPFFADITVSLDQQLQSIVGQDALGNVRYRIPLNEPNQRRRSYMMNPSLNYGAVQGHLLVVSLGYQVLAIDTLNARGGSWQNVLWKHDLTEQLSGVGFTHLQARPFNKPGGLPAFRAVDGQDRFVGLLGPILPQGVVFQRYGELVCVDPISGSTLWTRRDPNLPQGCELLGDEQVLLVIPPGSTQATVLRTLDGSLLGTRPVPRDEARISTAGRMVVRLAASGGELVLSLVDPWEQQTLWTHKFSAKAKTWRVEGDALAVMEPSGKFMLLSLPEGKPLIEQQLDDEPNLDGIFVLRSADQVHLVTNRQVSSRDAGRNFSAAPGGFNNPLITGRIYAFDRATGKMQWPVPATIDRHGLMLPQPSGLPVLTFVRHIVKDEPGDRRTKTSVLCIDKRTGRAVLQEDDFSFTTSFYSLLGDPAKQSVVLSLPSTSITLQWTDEAVPPEPPVQAGSDEVGLKQGKGLFGIFGTLGKALGRAAGMDHSADGFFGNPFGDPLDLFELDDFDELQIDEDDVLDEVEEEEKPVKEPADPVDDAK